MNKKISNAVNFLFLLIFSLVAIFSIILTKEFITPPSTEDSNTTLEEKKEEKVEEDKNESFVGTLEGNLLQHYINTNDYGLVDSNNKYIFKYQNLNGQDCLTKTNIEDGSFDVILTGYKVKGLNIIKKNLYMILEQHTEESTSQVIAYMDIEKNALTTISQTRADEILAFVSDGNNIYYTTNEDDYIYSIDKDNHVEKLFESNRKANNPILVGINKGLLYYINGMEMCSLGIHSHKNTVISTQYCSIDQYPILTNTGIVCFYDLVHSRLDILNYDGTYRQTLIDEETSNNFQSRISSINYSCGYIFLSVGDKIFYIDKSDYSIKQLEEATAKTSEMYLTDEYLILETEPYGTPEYYKIVWLLAG